ncbi:thioredoxin family protein [Sphingobacterium sp.]|uniref:TlpA family protein disulfide reductase n=1 Tax=Sphingobacterium sp. TaxID=341027 RepID=UPI0031E13645
MKKIILHFVPAILCLVSCLWGYGQKKPEKKHNIKVKVDYTLNKPGDTLTLYFKPHESIKFLQMAIVDQNGICSFDMEQEFEFGSISIEKYKAHKKNDHRMIANQLYWEKGDEIMLKVEDNQLLNDYESNALFTGPGSEKYNLQYAIRKELRKIYDEALTTETKKWTDTDSLQYLETKEYRLISVLNTKKEMITAVVYDVLKTDILMSRYEPIIENLTYLKLNNAKESAEKRKELLDSIHRLLLPVKQFPVVAEAMAASQKFQKFIGGLFYVTALLKNNKPILKESIVEVSNHFSGIQKESILISLLQQYGITSDQKEFPLLKNTVKTFPYNLLLEKFLQQTCRNLAGYTFLDTSGYKVDLKKYRGKYLLIDFWYIGCGGCLRYYQNTLSHIEEEFKDDPRFAVVSISADRDFNRWKKSIPLNRYTNERVINLNTGPLAYRHKFAEDIGIDIYPFVLLVDPNGNILEYNNITLRTTTELLRNTLNKYLN